MTFSSRAHVDRREGFPRNGLPASPPPPSMPRTCERIPESPAAKLREFCGQQAKLQNVVPAGMARQGRPRKVFVKGERHSRTPQVAGTTQGGGRRPHWEAAAPQGMPRSGGRRRRLPRYNRRDTSRVPEASDEVQHTWAMAHGKSDEQVQATTRPLESGHDELDLAVIDDLLEEVGKTPPKPSMKIP